MGPSSPSSSASCWCLARRPERRRLKGTSSSLKGCRRKQQGALSEYRYGRALDQSEAHLLGRGGGGSDRGGIGLLVRRLGRGVRPAMPGARRCRDVQEAV